MEISRPITDPWGTPKYLLILQAAGHITSCPRPLFLVSKHPMSLHTLAVGGDDYPSP